MHRRLLLLVFCFLLQVIPGAAAKRAFTIEDLYRVRGLEDLHVSPDGKSVLFTLHTNDLAKAKSIGHVWLMDADGKNARQFTFGEKGESAPVFSQDSKWIAFISARDGDDNLYVISASGGEARQLSNISTGVSDPLWSPDDKWIAFSSDVYPECSADDACNKKIEQRWSKGPLHAHTADALLYRHWTQWKDGKRTHVLLTDVSSGAVRDLTPGGFDSPPFQLGGSLRYDFSPDSAELAFDSNHDRDLASSTNSDVWIVPLSGNQPPRNITASNPAFDGHPKYSPDGKYIAYQLQKQPGYESDLFRLAIYDRSTGASRVLTESFHNWVDAFQWAPDSRSLYFTAPVEGDNPIFRVTLDTSSIQQVLVDRTIDDFELSPDNRRIIYTRRSVGEPVEIFAADIANGKSSAPQRLSQFNNEVANEVDIRPAERMWVKGADGAKIEVFIVKPHNFDPSKKYPLILNVHGGPQQQWQDSFRGDWQIYPGAGYVVAFANPHGSTGYGQDFTAEISGDHGGKAFEDLMKVTDELSKLPYVDPDRMGAMGWSYGGYMMDWFEGHTIRFKAIASMMGIFDLRSMYGATEELWFPKWDYKGQPWNSDQYEKFSPSYYVKNFKTPCLVISGERDYRVPYTQSLQMFTSLQEMNVPSRLIVYSDAGHWPSWYEMALYYTAHLEWFHQYLGGDAPPWSTDQFLRNTVFDKETGRRIK
ncbi:MAG: prolyl oligopeptidase family serine peptidase [Candidatus Sulfotelmatobacter sp.]|jgi:dipeptidyl aminopeptidase/acylaminoacyl peptidase